jgi:hypothetical protein
MSELDDHIHTIWLTYELSEVPDRSQKIGWTTFYVAARSKYLSDGGRDLLPGLPLPSG